jgi:hypothetical protein
MQKLPNLVCNRYVFYFSEGWQVTWHPVDPADHRGDYNVGITHHHDRGGDSVSYGYKGPASLLSSIHLIKRAIKNKDLPKSL